MTYSHNPYRAVVLVGKGVYPLYEDEDDCAMVPAASGLSDGDCSDGEEGVWGREPSTMDLDVQIPFYKYDASFRSANESLFDIGSCVRVFAGQLPYDMTASAAAWAVWAITGVHAVRVEKIIRWRKQGQPCGCFHVYCLPQDEARVLGGNELALVDGDGVWVAESALHVYVLKDFCRALMASNTKGTPRQMVTLQPARSTFTSRRARTAAHNVRISTPPPQCTVRW